jgi:alpha-amylase/alpha-mannosidase (GH57 family)
MSDRFPLYVVLMWHMHQPYYKDIRTGKYIMPWVRLHSTKDYLDMVLLMQDFPRVKGVFNMVPSLLEQIEDCAGRGATDLAWDITSRPAHLLNDGEKHFVLEKFFYAHYDNMIKPYPRYRELFEKRGWAKSESELLRVAQYFTEEDFRDLQTWYNLAWIDPFVREQDSELRRLFEKGRGFTEQEKLLVLQKHQEIMSRIVPTYRQAEERGQIEITCTPFYHPILPLVYDTNIARVARPQIALPQHQFTHPADARAQVQSAVEYHEKLFGVRPRGMWPAEGSVAPEVLPLFAEQGIKWIATDEEILGQSLGQQVKRDLNGVVQNPDLLYQPYFAEHDGSRLAMIFRDHYMSDLIGFQYAGWKPGDAARDLVSRIEAAGKNLPENGRPYLLSIILDGENCWEHYQQDGVPFLTHFYELLSESRTIQTTRVCDYLEQYPPDRTLPKLFAGSWINHDFGIWIGHREDNQSWDYLYEVRELIEQHIEANRDHLTQEQMQTAWKEIYIAEGSDWNWWYGDDHTSGIDEEFDQLYRDHLMTACQAIGIPPPSFLYIPIKTKGLPGHATEPKAFIRPVVDGRNTTYYEWFSAGVYDPSMGGGSMHQAQYLIRRVFYGFDEEHFYFRFDADHNILKPAPDDKVTLNLFLLTPQTWKLTLVLHGRATETDPHAKTAPALLEVENHSVFESKGEIDSVAIGQIIEVALPFSAIHLAPESELYFYATLEVNGRQLERCPIRTPLRVTVPHPDYESRMWLV